MSKIMLIDDDESLRELVGQIAAREGWDEGIPSRVDTLPKKDPQKKGGRP